MLTVHIREVCKFLVSFEVQYEVPAILPCLFHNYSSVSRKMI